MIESFNGKKPRIHKTAFVHPSAVIIGDVVIGEHSSVWPGAVIRGDFGRIRIGRYTCIQDNAVVHVGDFYDKKKPDYYPVRIGNHVIVGHHALVHGCVIEDQCVIGGGATVFNGARVRKGALVGMGSVVLRDVEVPSKTIVVGIPARPLRKLSNEEFERNRTQAKHYAKLARAYLRSSR
ncbi:MAG TPA: gamma carbonic anhydrase family protein [Hadesarchaea archaeon]|nr:gamma carbonic anhydrase family protein [Hadesarchaea archaeon]